MANENSVRDDNRVPALLVHDTAGTATKKVKLTANSGIPVDVVAGSITADSEFPAAALLADAKANPTTTVGASAVMVYNGTTWDLVREVANSTNSTGTGIQSVALIAQFDDAAPSSVTENYFANVRMGSDRILYVQGGVAAAATDSGNPIKMGGKHNTTLPTYTNGQRGDIQLASNGALIISGSIASGSTDQGNPVKTGGKYNSTPITLTDGQRGDTQLDSSGGTIVNPKLLYGEDATNNVMGTANKPVASATYSGTAFTAQLNDVDVSVKASAGNLLTVTVSNTNAAARYLQVHNKASAPAAGETAVMSFVIPAGTATQPAIREIGIETLGMGGFYLSTGIAIGISTVAATFTAATTTDHTLNGTFI